MLLKNKNCIERGNGKATLRGKIIEICDNGDEIGFWFYAGPGPTKSACKVGLLKQALFAFP